MLNTATYNFKPFILGDTANEVEFDFNLNNSPDDLTNAKVELIAIKEGSTEAIQLNTDNGLLIKVDTNKVKTNFGIIKNSSGNYKYDLKIYYANGVVKTRIIGTITIKKDITWIPS